MQTLDEGENFRLLLHEEIAVFQVWARPDVTPEQGARYAGIAMNTLRLLLGDEEMNLQGLVFDLTLAPGTVGPTTEAQLRDVCGSWSAVERWVAFLVAEGQAELQAQLTTALAEVAPVRGYCTSSAQAAYNFARTGQRCTG